VLLSLSLRARAHLSSIKLPFSPNLIGYPMSLHWLSLSPLNEFPFGICIVSFSLDFLPRRLFKEEKRGSYLFMPDHCVPF
jgi:hypothetical protein